MRSLPRPTRRGLVLAAAGIVLIVAGAFTGFTDLVRAGIFALLLLAISLLVLVAAARASAQVRHTGPRLPLEPGDRERVDVVADLSTSARLAGGTLHEPHTFGGPAPSWPVDGPRLAGSYVIDAPHRGRFTTGPTRLVVRDPFGLAEIGRDVGPRRELLVWPRSDLTVAPERSRSLVGDTSTESALAFGGEVGASVRQYVRGDDMRLVHWPATARRGELIVRQLDPPTDETARARVLGHVDTAGADAAWEGLLEACASWLSTRQRAHLPFALLIGEHTYRHHEEAMDALAAADDCPLGENPAPILFVHADTAEVPASAPAGAHAYVAGTERAVTTMRERLEAAGWTTEHVPDAAPLAHRHAPAEGAR